MERVMYYTIYLPTVTSLVLVLVLLTVLIILRTVANRLYTPAAEIQRLRRCGHDIQVILITSSGDIHYHDRTVNKLYIVKGDWE